MILAHLEMWVQRVILGLLGPRGRPAPREPRGQLGPRERLEQRAILVHLEM